MPLSEPTVNFRSCVPTFDANVGVGHRHDRPAPFGAPHELLAELDRHGVDRALVYEVSGEVISPVEANAALDRWIAGGDGRLTPQYVLGPRADSLEQLKALHAGAPLKAVRLMDAGSPRVPVTPWVLGEALAWLRVEGIPLWVSLADSPVREVAETLAHYPGLPSVLVGAHYTHASVVRPLLRRLPDARLELSRYEVMGEVESLAREFGARRLVYGSFYPRLAMGPVLHALHELDLPADDVGDICCRNLERLLGESAC